MNTSAEEKCRPGRVRLNELGFTLIDADNHYYEPHDAFTRHMEPVWRDRGFRWFTNGAGNRRPLRRSFASCGERRVRLPLGTVLIEEPRAYEVAARLGGTQRRSN